MSVRIAEVEAGAISSEIEIDLPQLRAEHEQRSTMYERALKITSTTTWDEVEQALEGIDASVQ
jgi:hypothetical protein